MANVLVQESSLSNIADAIRSKLDTEDTYKPSQMASAIRSISGGSPTINPLSVTENGTYAAPTGVDGYSPVVVNVPTSANLGTKTITENGTYNASDDSLDGYSSVTVNVSESSGNPDLDGVISGGSASVVSNITALKNWALYNTTLTNLSLPNLATAGEYAFQSATCNPSRSLYLPELVTVNNYTFRGFNGITKLVLPKVTAINKTALFGDMHDLEALDLGASSNYGFNAWACSGCSKLAIIVIRKNAVLPLSNVNALNATCFADGNTGGVLYVPSARISAYKSATGWSTILGYTNNEIRAIEGSIYETQYADGTAIS